MMRLLLLISAAVTSGQILKTDTYFYGQSPPTYPSPNITGTGDWASAYQKAKTFVQQLTLEEKSNLTRGAITTTGCTGYIPPIERLGFSGMCLQDAVVSGLQGADYVNAYASGLSVGASWNKALARARAHYMHKEFRAKGANVASGPTVSPLGRVVTGGRVFEGYSNDPYLLGALTAELIQAAREVGVMSCTRHFIGYEQETRRYKYPGDEESVSSNIDDKTLHELYLWPFQDAIKAGTASIMCSYNRLNNSYACGNSKSLNGILKEELGFQGFVVSDWNAQHGGVSTALAGLDLAMPVSDYWGPKLVEAVNNGSVPQHRLDDMATRIMAGWYYVGQDVSFPEPGHGIPLDVLLPHKRVNAKDLAAKPIILAGAVEGHVLVKNVNHALPLKNPLLLNLFGYSAKSPNRYTPADTETLFSPQFGVNISTNAWRYGTSTANATQLLETQAGYQDLPYDSTAPNGTIFNGGGAGASTPGYISTPFDALNARAIKDGTALYWDFDSHNPGIPYGADACIVFINAWTADGHDRSDVRDEYSDTLVLNVANNCNSTIVVIHNVGARLVDGFVDHPNVTAIIYAHLPGQDSGRALVSLLYGDENFSGRMPYTVAKNESDYRHVLLPDRPEGYFFNYPQSNFTEGIYLDYRAFEAKNITPRYEFGFGLSYTTFEFSDFTVEKNERAIYSPYPTGVIESGGHVDLWDILAQASVTIRNTGNMDGQEVVQLYIKGPNGVRWLRGFDKVCLAPGKNTTVTLGLKRRDLSEWDVTAQKWKLISGKVEVFVGASSSDIRGQGSLEVQY